MPEELALQGLLGKYKFLYKNEEIVEINRREITAT